MPPKPCSCGSGKQRSELRDARGIFCTFICSKCEAEKRKRFRPEIFTDSQYETVEPISETEGPGIGSNSEEY
jgi:hypothetical protein